MALAWTRFHEVVEAAVYDGTNATDIMAFLTSAGMVPTLNADTTITFPFPLQARFPDLYTLKIGDRVIKDINCGSSSIHRMVRPIPFAQFYALDTTGSQTDIIALGTGIIPSLIGGATINVDVTLRPTYTDTNYQAVAVLTGTVSILAALSIISTTIISATIVRVRIQNTGLLTLSSGGVVLVSAIHN